MSKPRWHNGADPLFGKMTRPTAKTPEMEKAIINMIVSGHNITSICSLKGMPVRKTVYRWLLEDKQFYKAYKKACWLKAQEMFLDLFEIADRPKESFLELGADKLRVTARLKAAALNPALRPGKKKKDKKEEQPNNIVVTIVPPGINPDEDVEWVENSYGHLVHPSLGSKDDNGADRQEGEVNEAPG